MRVKFPAEEDEVYTKGKPSLPANVDPDNAEEVREYFAKFEQDYPQVIEAMKVMNISYRQYLMAIRSLAPHSSFSTSQSEISL